MSRARRSLLPWFFLLLPVGSVQSADEPDKPPTVPVAKPVVREVSDFEDFPGRTAASRHVELRARATGYVEKTSFTEGDDVKQGEVLFEIDPRPYQAQLEQALSQLKVAQAALDVARATVESDLKAGIAVSQLQIDIDKAQANAARARVDAAEAAVKHGKLKLSWCQVTAPISGRIGRCLADPGNLVIEDKTQLATLVALDPLYVEFAVDERSYVQIVELKRREKGGKLQVAVGLLDEQGFSHQGIVDFIDNEFDPKTRTIRLRSTIANKGGVLAPGMSVRVRLTLSPPHNALLVSDQAVGSDMGIKFVYVVDAGNKVRQRRVTAGQLHPDGMRVIADGLTPDDRVVVGKLKELLPGMTVSPQEGPAPKPVQPPEKEPLTLLLPSARVPTSGIQVEATYPGASAEVVSDVVRRPIEEQVNGMYKLHYLRSRCTSDGRYALNLALVPDTDANIAQTLAQNRVTLALPSLPGAVQDAGITVKRGSSGPFAFVTVFSTDDRRDRIYLSNFVDLALKDELARTVGVSNVVVFGGCEARVNAWLDPMKLAAYKLNAVDVTRRLRAEKLDKLNALDGLGDLIVKPGTAIRLKDIARVELGSERSRNTVFRDGKPAVSSALYLLDGADARVSRTELGKRLDALRKHLPPGLELDVTFDFTANLDKSRRAVPEYLLVDLDAPETSVDGMSRVLEQIAEMLRREPGIAHVLALSEKPFDSFSSGSCILALLDPAEKRKSTREEVIRAVRTRLARLEGVTVRVRDLGRSGSLPQGNYPLDMALRGPEAASVRRWADELARRLAKSDKLVDVWANRDSRPRPTCVVEINRETATALGVDVADITNIIELYTESAATMGPFNAFGRSWSLTVRVEGRRASDWADQLRLFSVRNRTGQMVPLTSLVKIRESDAPIALDFLDMQPMVELTANLSKDVSAQAGQKLCESLADEVRRELRLPASYRLRWLRDVPRAKAD